LFNLFVGYLSNTTKTFLLVTSLALFRGTLLELHLGSALGISEQLCLQKGVFVGGGDFRDSHVQPSHVCFSVSAISYFLTDALLVCMAGITITI